MLSNSLVVPGSRRSSARSACIRRVLTPVALGALMAASASSALAHRLPTNPKPGGGRHGPIATPGTPSGSSTNSLAPASHVRGKHGHKQKHGPSPTPTPTPTTPPSGSDFGQQIAGDPPIGDDWGNEPGPGNSINIADGPVGLDQPNGPSAPSAVPEPATWAMMLVGFGAVGFASRRSRRKTQLVPQR
jgi:hypothetical protein